MKLGQLSGIANCSVFPVRKLCVAGAALEPSQPKSYSPPQSEFVL